MDDVVSRGTEIMSSNEKLYTQTEVCKVLGTYPRRFRGVVEAHEIPFQLVGGRQVFTKDAIEMARPFLIAIKSGPKTARTTA